MLALLRAAATVALAKTLVLWDGKAHAVAEGWVGEQCRTATIKKESGAIRCHTSDPKIFS